jgi:2-phosphosulfolactate phosphatase
VTDSPASSHDSADWFEQTGFAVRFGWGPNGLRRLAPGADVVVIVDVLSFSTSVDIALGRGAVVLPYKWHDGTEDAYAAEHDAIVARRTRGEPETGDLTLSPHSLTKIEEGTRIVLPSPNGSALTFGAEEAGAGVVRVGCLRNASAVGAASARDAGERGGVVSVIAAGERWRGATGPLRPALEDMLGAGAVIAALLTTLPNASPEARAAAAVFADARPELRDRVMGCGSGRELIGRNSSADVELAAELDASAVVPTLDGIALVAS